MLHRSWLHVLMACGDVSPLRTYVEASLELGVMEDVKAQLVAKDVPVNRAPAVGDGTMQRALLHDGEVTLRLAPYLMQSGMAVWGEGR